MINKTKSREEIGKALIQWRLKTGKIQKDVAGHLGIPTSTYRSYEDRKAEPSIATLKEISLFYGCKNVEELIDLNLILVP